MNKAIHNLILSLESEEDDLGRIDEPQANDLIDLLPGDVNGEDAEGQKTCEILLQRYYK